MQNVDKCSPTVIVYKALSLGFWSRQRHNQIQYIRYSERLKIQVIAPEIYASRHAYGERSQDDEFQYCNWLLKDEYESL